MPDCTASQVAPLADLDQFGLDTLLAQASVKPGGLLATHVAAQHHRVAGEQAPQLGGVVYRKHPGQADFYLLRIVAFDYFAPEREVKPVHV